MKMIFLVIFGLSIWSSSLFAEVKGDWRDELLKDEGIESSREALEKAIKGEAAKLLNLEIFFNDLGSDDFALRETAQKEFLKGGEKAMDWLRDHEASENPEVRGRVAEIISLLASVRREGREVALEHAMRSLLLEGEERTSNTGGHFYEWFGEEAKKLGEKYRGFDFEDLSGRGGEVEEGRLILPGDGAQESDQRLILNSKNWPGQETFGESFQVSVKLGGGSQDAGDWHVGVSIGKVRALFHPGMSGGLFRFWRIDGKTVLTKNKNIGFTPGEGELQWMLVKVRRLENGKVKLEVVLEEGGEGEGRFETSIVVDAETIGRLDQVSLDRGGLRGGTAFFSDFSVELAKEGK